MRAVWAVLCIGAVTFLLRVLAALVREMVNWSPHTVKVHFAKFSPHKRRGELIEMKSEARKREDWDSEDWESEDWKREARHRNGHRIGL
jgi:hypothetical protein